MRANKTERLSENRGRGGPIHPHFPLLVSQRIRRAWGARNSTLNLSVTQCLLRNLVLLLPSFMGLARLPLCKQGCTGTSEREVITQHWLASTSARRETEACGGPSEQPDGNLRKSQGGSQSWQKSPQLGEIQNESLFLSLNLSQLGLFPLV